MRVISLLEAELRRAAPEGVLVRREMSVILDQDQRPEPDLCVIPKSAEGNSRQTFYRAPDVMLVVEVVSPESAARDRKRKPELYAEAGIPHFWRVEDASDMAVVYAYELDPATRSYVPTGIHRERLKVIMPFDLDIDLTAIERM
jgi:Uma2 family endonuclease